MGLVDDKQTVAWANVGAGFEHRADCGVTVDLMLGVSAVASAAAPTCDQVYGGMHPSASVASTMPFLDFAVGFWR